MKILSTLSKLFVASCLSFSMIACSSQTSSVEIPDTKDIQKIQDAGVLKVGVKKNVKGFGYKEDGSYTGLEVDLAKKLADDLGVKVEYTSVTPTTRQTLLEEGKIDCVLATYTITEQRKELFDFSPAYYTGAVSVLVDDDNIQNLSDLSGRVVGVVSTSESAKQLVSAMVDQGLIDAFSFDENNFDASVWTEGVSFHVYDDYTSVDTALSVGDVDGFCTDVSILQNYEKDQRHIIDDTFAKQPYGVATTKGSGLSKFVKNEIKTWKKDGSIKALIKSYGI